jgi:hypothetical protein
MVSFIGFIVIYVIGGITFLPFIALATFVYVKGGIQPLLPKQKPTPVVELERDHDNVIVKKGWIRLINQYQPKMPEIPSTNGGGIISGIQSYVSGSNNSTHRKGLYYAVLKHGTLFCYDSEKQTSVAMILPMHDFSVSLYPPKTETIPEGQMYNRTSLVCLVPNALNDDIKLISKNNSSSSICTLPEEDITSLPNRVLYLTCARNIDKEDWYFGLVEAHHMLQVESVSPEGPQYVMMDNTHFDASALEELIRQVQSTPSHRETAWINAVFGRLFLAMYKTDRLKDFVETKIRKKIDKTKRPTFLDEIHVRSVNVGESVPFITNPKLLSLSPEGEVIVEAKVEYQGGLTIEIETDFNWSYSSRLKPIRMNLILAVTLKKLTGRIMFKLKAPPTNRYWLAFFEMPEMEWKITPVVADKLIKLNIITNAIESRIREVMAETFVLPNMDDTSFCPSGGKGGIFGEYLKVEVKKPAESVDSDSKHSFKHERSSSSISIASSSSGISNKNLPADIIRDTPTVSESIEKPSAADTLKLDSRHAESASDMAITSSSTSNDLAPLRKLEISHSTPEMQPLKNKLKATEDSASVKSIDRQSTIDSTGADSSVSTNSKWSTSSYLRKRLKKVNEDTADNNSDTESNTSTNSSGTTGSGFLSKISNLLPTDQHSSSPDSVRSSGNPQPSTSSNKKKYLMNMAESFLTKRTENSKSTNEVKKGMYAERMADMHKRAEEKKRLSGSSTHSASIPPPSVENNVCNAPIVESTVSQKSLLDDDEDVFNAQSLPAPIKPRRQRASSAAHESSSSNVPISETGTEKYQPPLPPRRNSTPTPVSDTLISQQTELPPAGSFNEAAPPIIVSENVPAASAISQVSFSSIVPNDDPPTVAAPALPNKPRPTSPVQDGSMFSPPPLPTTPRPKRSSRLNEAQSEVPNATRPTPPNHEKLQLEDQSIPDLPPRDLLPEYRKPDMIPHQSPPAIPPRNH